MNIAMASWQPGVFGGALDSGGGSEWHKAFFKRLSLQGHKVMYLYGEDGAQPEYCTYFEDPNVVDVLIAAWRWELPRIEKYNYRNSLYDMQADMIKTYRGMDVPVIIHDEDHKITAADEDWLLSLGCILTEPSLVPRKNYRMLMYPNPFYYSKLMPHHMRRNNIVYIGNNYERYDQTVHYLEPVSWCYDVELYGNWLEPTSGSREQPEQVQHDMPHVMFPGRIPNYEVVTKLSTSMASIMLAKPSYCSTGFVTCRWWEAAMAGCPAFIPEEFNLGPATHHFFDSLLVVSNGYHLIDCFEVLREEQDSWSYAVRALRSFVDEYMTFKAWDSLLEEVVR